jgi:hypothetical protein
LHGSATAGAAVANGVEPAQHRIFEKGVVHVAAFVLGLQNVYCFSLADPSGSPRVVLGDKAGKRLANDKANVQRLAGMGSRGPAGTLQDHDVIRMMQHNIAGASVGNNLLQVGQVDLPIYNYQAAGCCQRYDLSVVSIGKGDPAGMIVFLASRPLPK